MRSVLLAPDNTPKIVQGALAEGSSGPGRYGQIVMRDDPPPTNGFLRQVLRMIWLRHAESLGFGREADKARDLVEPSGISKSVSLSPTVVEFASANADCRAAFIWGNSMRSHCVSGDVAFVPSGRQDVASRVVCFTERGKWDLQSSNYPGQRAHIILMSPGAGKTYSACSAVAQHGRGLHAYLTQIDQAHLTASMGLSAQLSTDLRAYIGHTKAYSVDRCWMLAEYTILAASLLTLDRERRLNHGCSEWVRLHGTDRTGPVLLPISSHLKGTDVSARLSTCLLGGGGARRVAHDLVSVRCVEDLAARTPDREALSRLLSMLPSVVEFTPAIRELHLRACNALAQQPVRYAGASKSKVNWQKLRGTGEQTHSIEQDRGGVPRYFDGKSLRKCKKGIDDDVHAERTVSLAGKSTISLDDAGLTVRSNRPNTASRPMGGKLVEFQPTCASLFSMPVPVHSETKSPFSTDKILQVLMGKLPKPVSFD